MSELQSLQQRLAALEAENAALREAGASAPAPRRRAHGWARTLLSTVLIVLGAAVAPVAVAATWANTELTDTERFVETFAPLADDPAVQRLVIDQVVAAIDEQTDIPSLTSDVIDGIIDLGTGERATRALELLKGPAAEGIRSLVGAVVERFVESDAFGEVWASALRISHTQVTGALRNDPDAAVVLDADGTIGLELGPIIDRVSDVLVERGVGIAGSIPSVERTVVIATSDALPAVHLVYGLITTAAPWLPWVSLLLLAAGVLAAHRRSASALAAAIALGSSMVLLLAGYVVGRVAVDSALRSTLIPSDAANVMYATVALPLRDITVSVLVLAVAVAIVVWLSGPFPLPRRLRAAGRSAASRLRDAAERQGFARGRGGRRLHAQRTLLRVLIAVIGAAVVLFVRPLSPALIIWTAVVAAVAVAILTVLEDPGAADPGSPDAPPDIEADSTVR
ncbi:hypothetical protein ACIQTT_04260 [Microbacterium sp. NPDC090225]|uniref:hypothetical protein n=1 Tax=Microbacterium sp. NPDC090225 TaxID=3364207 RepID=UPI00383033F5